MRSWGLTVAVAGLAMLSVPAFAADVPQPGMSETAMPQPGAVNYVEGAAWIDGRPINNKLVGSVQLMAGQELSTNAGKTEVLLTPGIFLRIDSNSTVKMISPDLAKTQVELEHGRAGVEVDQIFPQNCVQIVDGGVTTQLIKPGYYEFNAAQPSLTVFKGRAEVLRPNGRWETVKGHHELALNDGLREKPMDFNSNLVNDELYNWSSLRSQYLAEENNQVAGDYAYGAGFYPGWYWDPYAWDYTYIGWGPFMSPFGWGFYPWGGYWGWGGWGWPGFGFYGGGFYPHGHWGSGGGHAPHPGSFKGGNLASGGFHGGFGGGGFHGGGGMRGGR